MSRSAVPACEGGPGQGARATRLPCSASRRGREANPRPWLRRGPARATSCEAGCRRGRRRRCLGTHVESIYISSTASKSPSVTACRWRASATATQARSSRFSVASRRSQSRSNAADKPTAVTEYPRRQSSKVSSLLPHQPPGSTQMVAATRSGSARLGHTQAVTDFSSCSLSATVARSWES
jgi:hypothetical protein